MQVTTKYTAGSFTKNFSWSQSFRRLHIAIEKGFSRGIEPIPREVWRKRSGIVDLNRQLIPMNFFLYSHPGIKDDFILVDRLVEIAAGQPYNDQFARLALFAFHLANSGSWRNSKWPDGRVVGWANELIRVVAWKDGAWTDSAFETDSLNKFIERNIDGEPITKRKVLTNYRYMLESAGILVDGNLEPLNLRERWFIDAVELFWDRQVFDGSLPAGASATIFEKLFFDHEIYKPLGCEEAQGRAFVRAAWPEYSKDRREHRFEQLRGLRDAGRIAA